MSYWRIQKSENYEENCRRYNVECPSYLSYQRTYDKEIVDEGSVASE